MPPHFEAILLGWGALCAFVGVLSGIAMSRGARIDELRDFWRRGYAYARREAARPRRDRRGRMPTVHLARHDGTDRDAMAEPFGDVTLVPQVPRHG